MQQYHVLRLEKHRSFDLGATMQALHSNYAKAASPEQNFLHCRHKAFSDVPVLRRILEGFQLTVDVLGVQHVGI